MVDIPGNSSTTRTITVGGTTSDTLETVGDHDWFRISLTAGQSISVALDGITLEDPYLRIYDSGGNLLYENDDTVTGVDRDSLLAFTANYTGTYYIDAGAWDEGYTGTYQLTVSSYTPPPVGTVDELADQLVNGYWGGDDHHFNVTQGGSLTVNLTALTAAGQTLARAALQTWEDVIGVNFVEVTSGAQITFDDNEEGAFSDGTWSNGIISSAHVNVSTQWLTDYGTGLNSYSFQTYIHEIGHALGLGHQGNYNGDARFPYDASFYNDSWTMSVMSYFSQTENSYFAGQGFTEAYLVTPMQADILAMSALYGLSTTTRTGDTIYGFNSTAGSTFNPALYPNVAYTIFDSSGNDTLDYSGFAFNQLINLNAESFSNIGAGVGNVSIARGVVIENAIGGGGWDTLIGNSANNVLDGGGGTVNTISYATATGAVTINTSITGPQNTAGAGVDTLLNYQILIGSAFNDTLIGRNGTELQQVHLRGGDGNDTLIASSDGDSMFGDAGNDTLQGGASRDVLEGGSGQDELYGGLGDDTLYGGDGDDLLDAGAGADGMAGEAGDDSYVVDDAGDSLLEFSDGGTDIVYAAVSYSLDLFLENLTLTGSAPINGTGNQLANTIVGNNSANVLDGGWDNDTLIGNGGIDTLVGGSDDDSLDGGAGSDHYIVGSSGEHIVAEIHDSGIGSFEFDLLIFTATTASTLTLFAGDTGIEQVFVGTEALDPTGTAAINVDASAVVGRINITGNAGANHLIGGAAINLMSGGAGSDILEGGGGDDDLDGGTGVDQLYGGTGNDNYYVDSVSDQVFETANAGTDWVQAKTSYTLSAGQEIEYLITADQSNGTGSINLTGNEFDNNIYGNAAANQLSGGAGNDNLMGWDGSDTLRGGSANDTLQGGTGDDWLFGDAGNDSLIGGLGYDRMYGGTGDDTYNADDADDYAYENAGEGTDFVIATLDHQLRANVENLALLGAAVIGKGNELANVITGNDIANKLYGYDGDDQLGGDGGDDYLFGGNGSDTLSGGAGYDRMYGGVGNDTYLVIDSTDYAYEYAGEGTDLVVTWINHTLRANIEELELAGSSDLRGYGNTSDNLLLGNSGNNLLYGRDGNDTLDGNAGNDILYGENGNDSLEGGAGQDRYYGGAGADAFIFDDGDFAGMTSSTADRVHDFSQLQGDQISLANVDANTQFAGDQAFAFIGNGAFTGAAGELRSYQSGGNTYVTGDTNGDGAADFMIRLDGLHTLKASDFIM